MEPARVNQAADKSRAMVLHRIGRPLALERRRPPEPGPGEVLVEVSACAVCRTDLHVVDGELSDPKLPLVPGHEAVGRIVALGTGVGALTIGARIGVPWMARTCGACDRCRRGEENLCAAAVFTGYTADGGYADLMLANAQFALPLPAGIDDAEAAPLLCAGLIGHRTLAKAGDAARVGLYGFGAAAHIVAQICRYQGREVFAVTRPGDDAAQDFARALGAVWAGGSDERPPVELDAALIFAPVGALVPAALAAVRPGGIVVCGGIHMSDIPSFAYDALWHERTVTSVANLTRQDGIAFLDLAPRIPIETRIERFPLTAANDALGALRDGRLSGAAVLTMAA